LHDERSHAGHQLCDAHRGVCAVVLMCAGRPVGV
jgi:hypothetical protein